MEDCRGATAKTTSATDGLAVTGSVVARRALLLLQLAASAQRCEPTQDSSRERPTPLQTPSVPSPSACRLQGQGPPRIRWLPCGVVQGPRIASWSRARVPQHSRDRAAGLRAEFR
eukprot:scaffold11692_cov97-Isochrysis_galbana.AAC.6